ncbi:MAG: carboxypeptidase regulatory-like domain-containing protein [Coriobacteriaceae bacterium]|jgi:Fe-S-cluster-containing dehydrogenase component|nr:carboxypeptidase regulatory-like domain-containing protein [Coriobacteriaceae bacterium]
MKAFLIDMSKCVGCHDCQIGCKDEHCGQAWMPYAEAQPETGQFWIELKQFERGAVPHVRVAYQPTMCNHCEEAPCLKAAKDGAVSRRDDGLVIIDPIKSKGQRKIMDACPYKVIYWNDELDIPQKCTGCAHLLDGDHPINVPRCVDNCHLNVITFGEEADLDLAGTEVLHPEFGTKPRVFYRGLPKKFIAATVFDPDTKEVVIGAKVTAQGEAGTFATTTDGWGDFWLRDLPDADWTVTIEADGKKKTIKVSTKEEDKGLGDVALV